MKSIMTGVTRMKALVVVPGTTQVSLVDRAEPSITASDEVKLRIMQVGICGTDREEAAGGRALVPSGQKDLVIGHEMFGRVVESGKAVTRVKPGDYAVSRCGAGAANASPVP
jgi:threonine dehydrogenase-like Zn-dependent dehydrogenase